MAMSQPEQYWTADDLELLPDDGNRYEVIDGVLYVTPTPSDAHQDAADELMILLKAYAKGVGLHARSAPTAVRFSGAREVQPDLIVIPRAPRGQGPPSFAELRHLALVVEILSPSTKRVDRGRKRALYQEEGVDEYWIVDTAARTVERWRPNSIAAEKLRQSITWHPVAEHAPLKIDLVALFREVWND